MLFRSMTIFHLKDGTMVGGTSLGEGTVDTAAVLKTAAANDIGWFILEDEAKYPDSFASLELGVKNLKLKYGVDIKCKI